MKRFAFVGLVVVACFALVGVATLYAMRQAEDRRRGVDAEQVRLALENFDTAKRRLPQIARDANGELATSWRMELMPFFSSPGHDWNREEPWTAAVNSFHRNLAHYAYCDKTTNARLFAFAEEMSSIDGAGDGESRRIGDLPPATILFLRIPRDSDIHWMEPRDLTFDEALNDKHCPPGEEVVVTFADGQVWALTSDAKDALRTFLDPPSDLPNDVRERRLARFGRRLGPPND